MIDTTKCECCEDLIHHIEFKPQDVTFDGESFVVHLSQDEATHLHLCLRERVLNLDGVLDNG